MASSLTSTPKSANGESKETGVDKGEEMKVWEQHAGVIKMQRFDYAASNSILSRSHSAFFVTCPIKREKSATKEAISILDQYITDRSNRDLPVEEHFKADENDSKRRKTIIDDGNRSCIEPENDSVPVVCSTLSLVKLTKSGLLFLAVPDHASLDVIEVVSNIIESVENGTLGRPMWCHRIFPVQATCCLNNKDLAATVSKLFCQFVEKHFKNHSEPIKFAIAYNRRGLEELPQKKINQNGAKDLDMSLLDRTNCFNTVAAAVKDAAPDSSVDLKSPELSIFVELLPLAGISANSLVAAVSILPRNLVNVKPRLCIKPLSSDGNAKN